MKEYIIQNWDAITFAITTLIFLILYLKEKMKLKPNNDGMYLANRTYWINFLFNISFSVMAGLGISILKAFGIDVTIPKELYSFIITTTIIFSSVFIFNTLKDIVMYITPYVAEVFKAKIANGLNINPPNINNNTQEPK